jgi:8-oxoguanine deaminase
MRLGSGIAPVARSSQPARASGSGVDGSASNDASHLLDEARHALLLARVARRPGFRERARRAAPGDARRRGGARPRRHRRARAGDGGRHRRRAARFARAGRRRHPRSARRARLLPAPNVDFTIVNGVPLVEHGAFTGSTSSASSRAQRARARARQRRLATRAARRALGRRAPRGPAPA